MDPIIGTIILFAGNFAPRGWEFCQGQIMSIAQNSALFSLLGTTYGGDGVQTFALPDLRGRVPVGTGNGPGLPPVSEGEMAGSASVTLTVANMPAHNHTIAANDTTPNEGTPTNNFLASGQFYSSRSDTTLNQLAVSVAGGNQPFSVQQPYLGLNYIIATQGVYPSRP